jgi:hypothetical protein
LPADTPKVKITDGLRATTEAEHLAERCELAGSMGVFVDGLLRHFK